MRPTLLASAFLAATLARPQMPDMAMPVAADEALRLEAVLKTNPDDEEAHRRLAQFFVARLGMAAMRDQQAQARGEWMKHIAWLIDRRPELAGESAAGMGWIRPEEVAQVRAQWERVLTKRSGEPEVLVSAAMFRTWYDVSGSIDLLKRARKLGSSRAAQLLSGTYFGIFVAASRDDVGAGLRPPIPGGLAPDVQKELAASGDPDVYGAVGGWLVCFNRPAPRAEYVAFGESLVRRAMQAEPGNPRWKQALACVERASKK